MSEFEFATSSYSGGDAGQECVEVARNIPGTVAVRDSKDTDGVMLRLGSSAWVTFLAERIKK